MKHHESKLQQQCVRWFRYQYPDHVLFAIPNGGHRRVETAAIMKAEGTMAGVPDLFLAFMRGGYGGLFIEMKYGKGQPSELQDMVIERLRVKHYKVVICRTFDEFQSEVENYLRS